MIEDSLLNYGMAGIFISYLIYDRQVIIKKLIKSMDRLGDKIEAMKGGKK